MLGVCLSLFPFLRSFNLFCRLYISISAFLIRSFFVQLSQRPLRNLISTVCSLSESKPLLSTVNQFYIVYFLTFCGYKVAAQESRQRGGQRASFQRVA